jgi:hypothetical protein
MEEGSFSREGGRPGSIRRRGAVAQSQPTAQPSTIVKTGGLFRIERFWELSAVTGAEEKAFTP